MFLTDVHMENYSVWKKKIKWKAKSVIIGRVGLEVKNLNIFSSFEKIYLRYNTIRG